MDVRIELVEAGPYEGAAIRGDILPEEVATLPELPPLAPQSP